MNQEQSDNRYRKHWRAAEAVMIEVERYTVDEMPRCRAWAGDPKHPRMSCQFLYSVRVQDVCGATGKNIYDNVPVEECPLWKEK